VIVEESPNVRQRARIGTALKRAPRVIDGVLLFRVGFLELWRGSGGCVVIVGRGSCFVVRRFAFVVVLLVLWLWLWLFTPLGRFLLLVLLCAGAAGRLFGWFFFRDNRIAATAAAAAAVIVGTATSPAPCPMLLLVLLRTQFGTGIFFMIRSQ